MIISVAVPYICYSKKIIYNIDLTLISIAIIFPLVFAIRGAFRRREKALEHLSKTKSALLAIEYSFMGSKMTDAEKAEGIQKTHAITDRLVEHLDGRTPEKNELNAAFQNLIDYMDNNTEAVGKSVKQKAYSFLQKVHEGIENTWRFTPTERPSV